MKPRRLPRALSGTAAEDRRWVEEHVFQGGDLVAYGRLCQDLDETAPEDLWRGLREAAEAYLADGEGRIHRLHQRVDDLLEALLQRDHRFGYPLPFCHKGCANCCHEPVYCTGEEADAILDWCREAGVTLDRDKLARQLRWVTFDAKGDHTGESAWNDQPEADQACVFLDPEGRHCRIWPVRPLVCRVHLAEGTDRFCRPHNGVEHPEACGISHIEVSYLLSAVFTLHRETIRRTLGRLLLERTAQREGV